MRRRERRIEEILDTAMALLVDEGLDAVTVHRISRELELTVGALYRYFASKDDLVAALTRRVIAWYAAALADLDDLAPLERIVTAALRYQSLSRESPERFRLVVHMLIEPRQVVEDRRRPEVMVPAIGALAALSSAFDAASSGGTLAPGDGVRRAVLFWTALTGVLELDKLARLNPGVVAFDLLYRDMIRTILIGFGAAPDQVDRALQ